MSPVPLPVANSPSTTAVTASRQLAASTTTTASAAANMANSNTSYRQMAQTNSQSNNNYTNEAVTSASSSTATAVVANKSKSGASTLQTTTDMKLHHQTKEMSANSLSSSVTTTTNTTASANVITSQQCDSSSAASTTSSSGSDNNSSLNVKNESCDTVIKTEMESSENCNADSGETDAGDVQLSAMRHRPTLLSSMNAHIICGLCFGYLIDATTIVECLHSFCHSCLIKHLRTEQYCPRCEMMINTAKPNIKPDTTLQAIVYKLVPGLYEKELMRKRAFYKDRPEEAALASPEQRGDDTEHLIFSPSDYMSISLEYADTDELMKSNAEYNELLKPRYLKCPAMCTVAHLKKLVYGKFEINSNRFTIDIMYKVKTIILLDHYTLMDVAYIYTWKRDAPMRFYFRVKQSLKPAIRVKKNLVPQTKKEVPLPEEEAATKLHSQAMCIVHEPTPSLKTMTDNKILEPEEIKQENEAEVSSTTEILPPPPPAPVEEPKQFEIVQPQSPSISSQESSLTDKLKITIVNKAAKEKSNYADSKAPVKALKEKRDSHKTSPSTSVPKDERKVENIKLKIDLSKQNSVTIINMSDPQRKEIVKPVRPEKEWKVTKSKKEKDGSPKSSPKSSPHSDRKSKTPSPLTVPPLTIKAERISPLAKLSSPSTPTSSTANSVESPDEDQKSQFLKSFALAPIKALKCDKQDPLRILSKDVTLSIVPKSSSKELSSSSSKRKSKEPVKAIVKKPKLSPPLATEDFKIKLPPIPSNTSKPVTPSSNITSTTSESKKAMMPPPAPLSVMKPPSSLLKKPGKPQQSKVSAAPPGSLTPHPMHGSVQLAAPGSRTPIAKRYQPILPKASRPNPFANIPSDVNKILKDAGTEIKTIPNEPVSTKVYGPKSDANSSLMGPPPMAAPPAKTSASNATSNRSNGSSSKAASSKNNSYLNLALFNAAKSKGNEVPPGCRTPMYTPNSPIYSPSSPQYVPNYNIPTMPTYKYTPKPSNSSNSYLQSVLGSTTNQMSGLFPSPPVKKDNNGTNNNAPNSTNPSANRSEQQAPKRVYPFARSPSPSEDPPEKQLKVKSLLTSCNINIPSSLSITITREDCESSSNGSGHQKHKSPVNNYIEILKLPEQTADNMENKRSSPPACNSLFPNPPVKRVATPPLNATKPTHNSNHATNLQKPLSVNTPNTGSCKTATNHISPTNLNMMGKSNGINKPMTHNKSQTPANHNKSPVAASDKKTPSPEKRLNTSPNEQKSPKSPNGDGSAGKKFRHILPRQIAAPLPEVNIPKHNGNVIGTYSSPNGVNVKIHSNKKVPASKKSPGAQHLPQQQQQQQHNQPCGNLKPPQQSSTGKSQNPIKTAAKSPQGGKAHKTNQSQAAVNAANKLNATPNCPTLPPVLSHPMQAMLPPHLGAAAAAAGNQTELSKFLKENLLRAQVQAAVANQSNMFYPYAANAAAAAQLGQFNPAMYNYQQAYIMDQLSRMQRAGNDAFTEYMQKLKNSMEMQKTTADSKAPADAKSLQKSSTSPKSLAHSPSTSTANANANSSPKEQLITKTK